MSISSSPPYRRSRGLSVLALLTAGLLAGCQASPQELAQAEAKRIQLPEGWTPNTSDLIPTVPGVPVASWTGPDGAHLILYRTLRVPDPQQASLAQELENRLTNNPGLRVVRNSDDRSRRPSSAVVEVVAPGTTNGLAPCGLGEPRSDSGELIPIRQIFAARPNAQQTLWLTAIYADSAHGRLAPIVETIIDDWLAGSTRSVPHSS